MVKYNGGCVCKKYGGKKTIKNKQRKNRTRGKSRKIRFKRRMSKRNRKMKGGDPLLGNDIRMMTHFDNLGGARLAASFVSAQELSSPNVLSQPAGNQVSLV